MKIFQKSPTSLMKDETTFPHKPFPDEETKDETISSKSDAAVLTTTRDLAQDNLPIPGIIEIIDIQRFSSFRKLLRVGGYVIRFINNCTWTFRISRDQHSSQTVPAFSRRSTIHVSD